MQEVAPRPTDGQAHERVLLFNCMPERSPEVLLGGLQGALSQRGAPIDRALFVPGESTAKKLGADPAWRWRVGGSGTGRRRPTGCDSGV